MDIKKFIYFFQGLDKAQERLQSVDAPWPQLRDGVQKVSKLYKSEKGACSQKLGPEKSDGRGKSPKGRWQRH